MTMTSFEVPSWCGVYPMSASKDCRGLIGTPMVNVLVEIPNEL